MHRYCSIKISDNMINHNICQQYTIKQFCLNDFGMNLSTHSFSFLNLITSQGHS